MSFFSTLFCHLGQVLCQPLARLLVFGDDGLDVVNDVIHNGPLPLLDVEVRVEQEVDGQPYRVLPQLGTLVLRSVTSAADAALGTEPGVDVAKLENEPDQGNAS